MPLGMGLMHFFPLCERVRVGVECAYVRAQRSNSVSLSLILGLSAGH